MTTSALSVVEGSIIYKIGGNVELTRAKKKIKDRK